ncbi:unnamed protein product, partial [Didymodactylos carnosus]
GNTNQQWILLYKATKDGFDAASFHRLCDGKGPTMTIIQSNSNDLFGGYTSVPWSQDGACHSDTTAFLFTLINPYQIQPTKFISNGSNLDHIVRHPTHGPTFSRGRDIHISSKSNVNNSSYTNFPSTYADTTGKGKETFTGALNFTTSDIEVFGLA